MDWNAPGITDTAKPQNEACSKASGLNLQYQRFPASVFHVQSLWDTAYGTMRTVFVVFEFCHSTSGTFDVSLMPILISRQNN